MEGQTFWGKKCVMDQTLAIDRADGNAAHIRIPRNVVEIVEGKNSARKRLQKTNPLWFLRILLTAGFLDRKCNVFRSQLLSRCKRPAGAPPELTDDVPQISLNDRLTQILVGQTEVDQEIVVEEVAEGTMAEIVQQAGDPHVLFDESRRRAFVS